MDVNDEIQRDIAECVGGPMPGQDMAIGGPFEGAEVFDRWLATWHPSAGSADSDMLGQKALADQRSRDSFRNDAYLQSGSNLAQDGIVGSMYMLNAKPDIRVLGVDDEQWEEDMQEEVEAKFTIAAESANCYFDMARSKTFTGMLRLSTAIYTYAGEHLMAVEWDRRRGRPFKTAFQIVDLDRLSNPGSVGPFPGQAAIDGRIVRGGVHQDKYGAALGYYIREAHPADYDRFLDVNEWKYVPAEKPWGRKQIIHIKEERRAAQSRAVADIVAGLKATKIMSKFRDVTLQQAVVNAMYAASVESDLPPEAAYASMGISQGNAGVAVAKYGAEYMAAVNKFAGDRGFRIDGVKVPFFFPGTRLNLRQSSAPGGVGQEFEQSLLRYVAALLGVSYEELSKDFSKTNYSSARAAMLQTWKAQQAKKRMVTDRTASIMYMCWFEEQMNAGNFEFMKYSKLPNFYEGCNRDAYCAAEWIGAARGQIDELKETQAAVLRIKFGLSTHEEELAKLGKDWRRVYRQLERERIEREERGIVLIEDNSVNAASGTPREQDKENSEGEDATSKAA